VCEGGGRARCVDLEMKWLGVGFNMVQCRKTLYQVVEVVTTLVFDTKVVDD
jgi:hypothetical protein